MYVWAKIKQWWIKFKEDHIIKQIPDDQDW